MLQLQDAVELSEQRALSNLEKYGVIQTFEFTHELLIWHEYKIHSVRPEPVEGYEAIYVSTSSTRTASYYLLAGSIAWNVLTDYLQDQGNQNIKASKDATREAFKVELIADGEQWMAMIQSRNVSSHTYDERTAEQLVSVIIKQYFPLFVALQT